MLKLCYAWEPYLSYGQKKVLEKNMTVFLQGEEGSGFYYLSKGGIKNMILSEKGEERIISHIPQGMLFGEDRMNNNSHLGTATTTAPSVLYYFSDQALLEVCRDHPQAAIVFIHSQIYKFRALLQMIKLLDSPIERQMAYYLFQLAYETGDIPIDQTSMAKDLGTSRVTINKVIRKWKNQGVIRLSNRMIHILDKDWLQQEAE